MEFCFLRIVYLLRSGCLFVKMKVFPIFKFGELQIISHKKSLSRGRQTN